MSEEVWVDGPNHPDLFDGETPTRVKLPIDEIGLRVFKVQLTWYEPQEDTVFIVAPNEDTAETRAWDKVSCVGDENPMDEAYAEEVDWDEELRHWRKTYRKEDGTTMTAKDLLLKHLEENECTLTHN